MSELMKCPCCKSDASLITIEPHTHEIAKFMPDYDGGEFVECTNCTLASSSVKDWNARSERDPEVLLEALKAMYRHFGITEDDEVKELFHPDCIKASKKARLALEAWNEV